MLPIPSISFAVTLKHYIRDCHPFGTAFHSESFEQKPTVPHLPFDLLNLLRPSGWGAPLIKGYKKASPDKLADRIILHGENIMGWRHAPSECHVIVVMRCRVVIHFGIVLNECRSARQLKQMFYLYSSDMFS